MNHIKILLSMPGETMLEMVSRILFFIRFSMIFLSILSKGSLGDDDCGQICCQNRPQYVHEVSITRFLIKKEF